MQEPGRTHQSDERHAQDHVRDPAPLVQCGGGLRADEHGDDLADPVADKARRALVGREIVRVDACAFQEEAGEAYQEKDPQCIVVLHPRVQFRRAGYEPSIPGQHHAEQEREPGDLHGEREDEVEVPIEEDEPQVDLEDENDRPHEEHEETPKDPQVHEAGVAVLQKRTLQQAVLEQISHAGEEPVGRRGSGCSPAIHVDAAAPRRWPTAGTSPLRPDT